MASNNSTITVTIADGVDQNICLKLFKPYNDIDTVHNVYATGLQLAVTTLFVIGLGIRNMVVSEQHKREKADGGTTGQLLTGSFSARLAFGFAYLATAWVLDAQLDNQSSRHLRIALALSSLFGAQGIIICALLFKDIWIKRRFFYLASYTIVLCAFTVRAAIDISKVGRKEEECLKLSKENNLAGRYDIAMVTVITTPIWYIVNLLFAIWAGRATNLKYLAVAITFAFTYTFVVFQFLYLWRIAKLYHLFYSSVRLVDTQGNQIGDTLLVTSKTPNLGQIVNYVLAIIPVIDWVISWYKHYIDGPLRHHDNESAYELSRQGS